MEIFRIAFVGHREIQGHYDLEERIQTIVRNFLETKEFVELMMGRNGDFDISAASAVKRARRAAGEENSSLILVQPYAMKDDPYYEKFYDEIYYPVPPTVHPKGAITKRNQWMMENSDLVIAFVEEGRGGGAMSTLRYAKRLGVPIWNLAEKNQ